jgi:hypothetical protein
MRDFKSHMHYASRCAPVNVANSVENSILQALLFQKLSVRKQRIITSPVFKYGVSYLNRFRMKKSPELRYNVTLVHNNEFRISQNQEFLNLRKTFMQDGTLRDM